MWSDYNEEAEKETDTTPTDGKTAPLKSEYLDVIVSDVRTHNGFGFSVQILNTEGVLPSIYFQRAGQHHIVRHSITRKTHERLLPSPSHHVNTIGLHPEGR
jgi:hypothetical protein